MAGSRLEKLGTVFSRVTALIRGGAIKRENKPIWYDVYQVFPPKTEPSFATIRPKPEIQDILYPEDKIRAIFHKKMRKRLPTEDLMASSTTDLTRRAIDLTYTIMRKDENLNEDQAVDKAIYELKNEGLVSFKKLVQPLKEAGGGIHEEENEQFRISVAEEYESTINSHSGIEINSYVDEYEEAIKKISDKNVDIYKIDEKDEK